MHSLKRKHSQPYKTQTHTHTQRLYNKICISQKLMYLYLHYTKKNAQLSQTYARIYIVNIHIYTLNLQLQKKTQ